MFAWKSFLESRNIPYLEASRHELVVRCPFCGSSDPSLHMSISLRNRGYRCFRSQRHSGRNYAQLMSALLGCSLTQARDIMGEQVSLPTEDNFAASWRRQLGMQDDKSDRPTQITFPPDLRPLSHARNRLAGRFWDYLYDRGFSEEQSHFIADVYRLQYAVTGLWGYRLIIPIYNSAGELVSWTGRTILEDEELRYQTLSAEQSVESANSLVLGLNFLWHVRQPRCLVICEGPFDAMAVTALGSHLGIWGTCLFGVQVSQRQAVILDDLSRRFDRTRLLVDPDARMKVLSFRDKLPRKCELRDLAPGLKDPGELPRFQRSEEFLSTLL